jgi:hypothetical protein
MQQYDWKQCAVLASNDAYGSGVSSALLNDAAAAGIAIDTVAYFSPTDTDFTGPLNTIARSKAKIIILAAIAGGGGRIALKQAVLKGLMGPESGYTWIIPEGSASQALLLSAGTESETSLSNAAFRRALLGNLATKPRGGAGPLWDSLMATWTSGSLNTTLFPGSPDPSIVSSDVYVPYSVDAVYTLAHAYLSIVQNGLDINSNNLKNALINISFVGVTGPVLFNSQFDRIVPYSIVNVRDTSSLFDTVGEWSSSGGTASLVMSTDPIWPDGTTKVPGDGLPRTLYWIKWSSPTSIVILIFVGIAIAICFATIVLVAKFSATPVMRLASPTFLMITLVGLSLFFSSLVPWMGAPSEASCNLRNWLGHLGICLALASIIAKTYRVDVIFRKRTKIKKVVVTNFQLVKYVALIMVPITALLIVWAIIDRAKPRRTIDTAENRINLTCGSKSSAWLIAAFVYDALLMVLSLILSFRTRRVPDGFNETWYIYISGYNTVVMGVVGVTLGYVLMKNLVAMTIVVSVTQLLGGLGLWALIFLPKLYIALIVPDQNSVNLKSAKTTRTLSSRSIGPEISHWKSNIDSTDSDTNNSKKVRTESKMDSDMLDPPKAEEGAENNKATEPKERRKKAATDGNKAAGRSQRKKKAASNAENKETPKSEDNGDATS